MLADLPRLKYRCQRVLPAHRDNVHRRWEWEENRELPTGGQRWWHFSSTISSGKQVSKSTISSGKQVSKSVCIAHNNQESQCAGDTTDVRLPTGNWYLHTSACSFAITSNCSLDADEKCLCFLLVLLPDHPNTEVPNCILHKTIEVSTNL